jgi:hypothetical protein
LARDEIRCEFGLPRRAKRKRKGKRKRKRKRKRKLKRKGSGEAFKKLEKNFYSFSCKDFSFRLFKLGKSRKPIFLALIPQFGIILLSLSFFSLKVFDSRST